MKQYIKYYQETVSNGWKTPDDKLQHINNITSTLELITDTDTGPRIGYIIADEESYIDDALVIMSVHNPIKITADEALEFATKYNDMIKLIGDTLVFPAPVGSGIITHTTGSGE